MDSKQQNPGTHSSKPSGQDEFSIPVIAAELGVSIQEVESAIEVVGSDRERVEEFIKRNHTELDDTNSI